MLIVNASKGPSDIHGFGLIARQEIVPEQIIWEFNPAIDQMLAPVVVSQLAVPSAEQVLQYALFDPKLKAFILSGDDDRFTNHSEFPNTEFDSDMLCSVAIRPISEGEEITINYNDKETTFNNLRRN